MSSDNSIREQGYQYFLTEAPELLQAIEQEIFSLREDYSLVKVHSLMRTTHTLKGAAANVGLDTIKTIAHHLEDVFKALYNPELSIDNELEILLLQGYECLRLPLMSELTGSYINDSEVLERAVAVFAQLQEKMGDYFARETPIPTSVELGFDITKSIFEVGVKQRLEELTAVSQNSKHWELAATLREQAEIFVGLAESLNLPGFGAIAQKTLTALELHPQQAKTVLEVALPDFWQAWNTVMAGDRTCGGEPSFALQQMAGLILPESLVSQETVASEVSESREDVAEADIYLAEETTPSETRLVESTTPAAIEKTIAVSEDILEPSLEDVFGNFNAETTEAIFEPDILDFSDEPAAEVLEECQSQDLELIALEPPEFPSEAAKSPEAKKETSFGLPAVSVSQKTPESTLVERKVSQQKVQPSEVKTPTPEKIKTPATNSTKTPRQSVRVELELLERLSYLAGELLINQNRQTNIAEQLQEAIAQIRWRLRRHQQTISLLRDWSDELLSIQPKAQNHNFRIEIEPHKNRELPTNLVIANNYSLAAITHQFDSLELDRYSELHELLQSTFEELVQLEEATDSTEILARQGSQILEKQRRLLHSVQDDMREARMLPLGEIFSRFPRLLQQLSNSHQKPVDLQLYGTDVLVDRALAEKLYDPLLHLVRNAFDHGIESPNIRNQRGKSPTGRIEIRAYHRGNQTMIEVSDDGGGIDFRQIRQQAVELNWMSTEQANSLSEAALLNLLFEPGFSTASQVSELSGRGIGLNVVRSQMQGISGTVVVHSQPQQGTSFILQFPLTLTMGKLLVCEVGTSVYALLSDAIDQILIPKNDQIREFDGQKVLYLSKASSGIIPIYNLADLLGYSYSPISQAVCPLLLLRQNHDLVGLEVDQIVGEQELVIRPLGKAIAPPVYIYGGSTLADGRLTIVIDGDALVNHLFAQVTEQSPSLDRVQIGEAKLESELTDAKLKLEPQKSTLRLPEVRHLAENDKQNSPSYSSSSTSRSSGNGKLLNRTSIPKILVVDDSVSVRQTLALVLQKAGYQTVQAQNGREALQQMRQHPGIKLVICDIEMPSMNGFEFLSHWRQDPEIAKVPVVMLTSRSGDKHRMIASELGALGYFTKPYRDEEMLTAIADLLKKDALSLIPS